MAVRHFIWRSSHLRATTQAIHLGIFCVDLVLFCARTNYPREICRLVHAKRTICMTPFIWSTPDAHFSCSCVQESLAIRNLSSHLRHTLTFCGSGRLVHAKRSLSPTHFKTYIAWLTPDDKFLDVRSSPAWLARAWLAAPPDAQMPSALKKRSPCPAGCPPTNQSDNFTNDDPMTYGVMRESLHRAAQRLIGSSSADAHSEGSACAAIADAPRCRQMPSALKKRSPGLAGCPPADRSHNI